MARHRNRTTKPTARSFAPSTPSTGRTLAAAPHTRALPPSGEAAQDDDLVFGRAVDRMLSQRAAERAAGLNPSAWVTPATAAPKQPLAAAAPKQPINATFPVAGMTCRSCEVRIQRFVGRLPNVQHVTASAVHGRVEVVTSAPVSAAAIEKAINAAGYEIGRTPWFASDPMVWATVGVGIVLVLALAFLAQLTGLSELASGVGDLSRGGIFVALLLGLAAGVSTCMALVGGLVLAVSASFEVRRTATAGEAGVLGRMRPALVFMAGRVVGYAVLGAALGALGSGIALPTRLVAVLMIAVAIVMTLIGTRLTGLSPRIAAWSPTLPVGLARSLGLDSGSVAAYSDTRAAFLGAATFFVPCGFTQAVQLYVLSTGSAVTAGVIMATFALGTAPGLLAVAGLPAVMPERARPTLLRVIGVVVIGFAIVNATAGLRLAGVALPSLNPSTVAAAPLAPAGSATGATQALHTFQDVDGYRPGNVAIYAGSPTLWTIESTNPQSCAAFLRVPALDIAVVLHKGLNQIDLPAMKAGTLSYTCSMGMYGGTITIMDKPSANVTLPNGGG